MRHRCSRNVETRGDANHTDAVPPRGSPEGVGGPGGRFGLPRPRISAPGPERTFRKARGDDRFAVMRCVWPASQRDAEVTIGEYFSALLSLDGELDRKRYGSLLAPVAFFFGGL